MSVVASALAVTPALAGGGPDSCSSSSRAHVAGEDCPPPAAQPTPTPTPTPTQPNTPQPTPTSQPALRGSAHLRTSQCSAANKSGASVNGSRIESVAFFVDGKRVKTVFAPDSSGRFGFSMSCERLSVGTHRARANVRFQSGVRPGHRTLMFQITRAAQVRPQFTG